MISRVRLALSAFSLLVTLSFLLVSSGCADEELAPAPREQAQPVVVTAVKEVTEQTRVEAVGTSRALQSVTLYPESAGVVEAVNFSAGDKVQAGDVLLELETRDERLAVELAKTELADARRLLDRYQRTEGSGAVTPSTLDEAQTAVERAKITLERARVALRDRRLIAPFTGHIGLTTIDPGARVTPETAVTTLDDRSQLLVTFPLPELVFGQLQPGQAVATSTWTSAVGELTGTVVHVDSRVDPATRTFLVRARVDNSEDRLRPGMSFRITLEIAGARYPQVPEVALQWGGDGAYVWVVDKGVARRVAATVVQRNGGAILVDADLPVGALVVSEGVQRMREGLPVRTVDPEAALSEQELKAYFSGDMSSGDLAEGGSERERDRRDG